jgi:hypothetical protein
MSNKCATKSATKEKESSNNGLSSTSESECKASIAEEPGAGKPHAGICEGALRATGRPTSIEIEA